MNLFPSWVQNVLIIVLSPVFIFVAAEGLAYLAISASSDVFSVPDPTLDGRPRLSFHPVLTGLPLLYSNPFGREECTMAHPIFGNAHKQSEYCRGAGEVDRYGFLRNSAKDRIIDVDSGPLIFVLGGSTVHGHGASGITKTITANLEVVMKSEGYKNAQVINAGREGYYSTQELDLLAHEIGFFSPDIVVSLNGINDLRESINCCRNVNDRPYTYYMNESSYLVFNLMNNGLTEVLRPISVSANNLKTKLYRFTYLGWMVYQLETRLRESRKIRGAKKRAERIRHMLDTSNWREQIADSDWEAEVERGVHFYTSYVRMTSGLARATGVHHLQVFQPSSVWDFRSSGLDAEKRERRSANTYLSHGVDLVRRAKEYSTLAVASLKSSPNFIDMRGLFDGTFEAYTDGVHYTDAGNAAIAHSLYQELGDRGWLSKFVRQAPPQ